MNVTRYELSILSRYYQGLLIQTHTYTHKHIYTSLLCYGNQNTEMKVSNENPLKMSAHSVPMLLMMMMLIKP